MEIAHLVGSRTVFLVLPLALVLWHEAVQVLQVLLAEHGVLEVHQLTESHQSKNLGEMGHVGVLEALKELWNVNYL